MHLIRSQPVDENVIDLSLHVLFPEIKQTFCIIITSVCVCVCVCVYVSQLNTLRKN
jgi:hypothetical protein